jgi:hypothetical protein
VAVQTAFNSAFDRAPAVPPNLLLLESVPDNLKARFEALMLEPDFAEATTKRDQAGFACTFLRKPDDTARVSEAIFGRFLTIDKGSVRRHHNKYIQEPEALHRPPTLTDEAMAYIQRTLAENFAKKTPVSYRQLMDALHDQFNIAIKPAPLRHAYRTIPSCSWLDRTRTT